MTDGQGGSTPAGWYPDPEGNGQRWWNGMSWGQLRAAPAGQQQHAHPAQYGQQQHSQPPQQGESGYPHGQQGQQGRHGQQRGQENQQGEPSVRQGMRCVHCEFQDFAQGDFVLTPGGGQFFDRGIGMATAQCLICRRCGFIHWFAGR